MDEDKKTRAFGLFIQAMVHTCLLSPTKKKKKTKESRISVSHSWLHFHTPIREAKWTKR